MYMDSVYDVHDAKERAMAIASVRHKHLRIDQAKLDKARRIPRRDD